MTRSTPLRLRQHSRPVRPVSACYIASPDCEQWVEVITQWQGNHADLRLLPIPASRGDRRACGVLVFAERDFEWSQTEISCGGAACLPYGNLTDNVFLPVDTRIEPRLSAALLANEFWAEYRYVWHPGLGVVAFEAKEIYRVSDLLVAPAEAGNQFVGGQIGVQLATTVREILPAELPNIDSIRDWGQGDIGTESDDLANQPPAPGEPSNDLLQDLAAKGKEGLLRVLRWATQPIGDVQGGGGGRSAGGGSTAGGAAGPTWFDKLNDWANEQLEQVRQGMSARRNKELSRLMHMLENDPDKGLRFAIPFGGNRHRGQGPPSDRLGERDVNFRLGGNGTGPADTWDIPWEYHVRLQARYRELANREMNLGRYRRAAYIFAELLDDRLAAAGALKAGRHFREAAVLYEQCGQSLLAAECFEEGGLWSEAIAKFEEMGEFERAGDACVRIQHLDRAATLFREAVEVHRAAGRTMEAAQLLEEKLTDVPSAIEQLRGGTPYGPQAVKCLRELCRLYRERGEHGEVERLFAVYRERPVPEPMVTQLTEFLVDAAGRYPDRRVRRQLSDCTRRIVSGMLQHARGSRAQQQQLLNALARLVPSDRLLQRDCDRYLTTPQGASRVAEPQRRSGRFELLRVLKWENASKDHETVRWETAAVCGASVVLAGRSERKLYLRRASWTTVQREGIAWEVTTTGEPGELILEPALAGTRLFVDTAGYSCADKTEMFPRDTNFPGPLSAGTTLPGVPDDKLALKRGVAGVLWIVAMQNGRPCLSALDRSQSLVATKVIPYDSPFETRDVHMLVIGDRVYVGIRQKLFAFGPADFGATVFGATPAAATTGIPAGTFGAGAHEFPSVITGLAGTKPHTRPRIAVSLESGAEIFWDAVGGATKTIAHKFAAPLICFNGEGHLIFAHASAVEIYATRRENLTFLARITRTGGEPIAVLPAPQPEEFGVVTANCEIEVYTTGFQR